MDTVKLIDELVTDEALRLKVYRDSVGVLTIGIGRNLQKGITRAEAYYLCHNDIDDAMADLDTKVQWWRDLSEDRQRVLVNMCFNMGIDRLLGFTHMLDFLHAGEYDKAADAMLDSLWARQVGLRSQRLSNTMRNSATV